MHIVAHSIKTDTKFLVYVTEQLKLNSNCIAEQNFPNQLGHAIHEVVILKF